LEGYFLNKMTRNFYILLFSLIIFIPVIIGIFWEEYAFSVMYFIGWSYVAYEQRYLFQTPEQRKKELEDLLEKIRKRNAKKLVDDTYNLCLNRDRSQSFDDWVDNAIQLMAIDEVERGETDEEIVRELKEKFGENNWEVFYPIERVKQELSVPESYWTGLRKFDDQVAKDLKKKKL
tara:strand:- start:1403 stop:1930 length:528 start_codon:yes stop_codon:yes gene_type:complete